MSTAWSVTITGEQWDAVYSHLFPGDGDEHGAVLRCGIARSDRGNRLLVRDVIPAVDGVDYVAGDRGYRKLRAEFVADNIDACAEEGLAYLAVHNHGGRQKVAFSGTDMASHERGYPALLDINGGVPVGALVVAADAVAGDIWLSKGQRAPVTHMRVVGRPQITLTPAPVATAIADPNFDRQTRIFGDRGQAILRDSKVAVVGLGGAGSVLSEYLARLGVGELILIDPDRIDPTNLPRVVGARRRDALAWLRHSARPVFVRRLGDRFAAHKVNIAARVAKEASSAIRVTPVPKSVMEPEVTALLTDCDHIFLAADSALARRLVNSVTHQCLIPNTQIGSKVSVKDGKITDIFSVSRSSSPGSGCLQCNGLIPAWKLTAEATSPEQLKRQQYIDDDDVHAPSVITLNAVAASRAVDDWLMSVGGLVEAGTAVDHWVSYHPLTGEVVEIEPAKDDDCFQCGPNRFALGDAKALPSAPSSRSR